MEHIDYDSFMWEERLKNEWSNFPCWHQHVRNVLIQKDLLYVLEETLAEAPRPNATAQDRDEYHEAHDISIKVQNLMAGSMEPHLKAYYQHHKPFAMIKVPQTLFAPQVRKQSYYCLNEFLSTKMEENTCI
jgi:hypothetical protein